MPHVSWFPAKGKIHPDKGVCAATEYPFTIPHTGTHTHTSTEWALPLQGSFPGSEIYLVLGRCKRYVMEVTSRKLNDVHRQVSVLCVCDFYAPHQRKAGGVTEVFCHSTPL